MQRKCDAQKNGNYANNVRNFGQHYFNNVNFRFAQIHIMKIMLTKVHDILPDSPDSVLAEKPDRGRPKRA